MQIEIVHNDWLMQGQRFRNAGPKAAKLLMQGQRFQIPLQVFRSKHDWQIVDRFKQLLWWNPTSKLYCDLLLAIVATSRSSSYSSVASRDSLLPREQLTLLKLLIGLNCLFMYVWNKRHPVTMFCQRLWQDTEAKIMNISKKKNIFSRKINISSKKNNEYFLEASTEKVVFMTYV